MRFDTLSSAALAAPRTDDSERHVFNTAFSELDLDWHWDEQTYGALRRLPSAADRLHAYLQERHSHLLKAYDAAFLVNAICSTVQRCREHAQAQAPRRG